MKTGGTSPVSGAGKAELCIATDGVAGHVLTQQRCDPNNPRELWSWNFRDDHSGHGYVNPASGLWMDVEGASRNNGTRIIGWYDNPKDNQLWYAGNAGWSKGISNSDYVVNDTNGYVHYTNVAATTNLHSSSPDAQRLAYEALALPPEATGWAYSPGRPQKFHDWNNDVHYNTADGSAVYYQFTGTGVSYISEISQDNGPVDIYIDGVLQKTADTSRAGVQNQGGQLVYTTTGLPAGLHDIVLVKKGGPYMLMDAFEVYP